MNFGRRSVWSIDDGDAGRPISFSLREDAILDVD
jgi:hypothetical protein